MTIEGGGGGVDHTQNIERIIEKIKALKIVRAVNFGDPENQTIQSEKKFPNVYVTMDTQNSSYDRGVNQNENALPVSVSYSIVISAHSPAKSQRAQKELYGIIKKIRELVQNDRRFHNSENTDPKFARSIINNEEWDSSTRGQLLTTITLTLLVQIGSLYFLTIPNHASVPILSRPVSREHVDYIPHLTVSGQLIGQAATTENKTRYYEIEDFSSIRTLLTSHKNSKEKFNFEINNIAYVGYLSAISHTYTYDNIPTLTLQFALI